MLNVWHIILFISTTNYHLSLPAYSCCSQWGIPSTFTSPRENWSTAPDFYLSVILYSPVSYSAISLKIPLSLLPIINANHQNSPYRTYKLSTFFFKRIKVYHEPLKFFSTNPSIFYMHRNTKKNASHYTKLKKLDTMAPKFYPPLGSVRAVLLTPTSGTAHRLCLKYSCPPSCIRSRLMDHLFSFSCTAPMHNVCHGTGRVIVTGTGQLWKPN